MKHFTQIGTTDVLPLVLQLERHPELWNEYRERKDYPGSAHSEMDDIWIRFRPRDELPTPESYAEPHFPVYYPSINKLYEIRPIINNLMARVHCVHLGGILITRVPPGAIVKRHTDNGWHANHFDLKCYIPIKSNLKCVNTCADEALIMNAGEIWTFDNLVEHSTENYGDDERITLIVSMRCE